MPVEALHSPSMATFTYSDDIGTVSFGKTDKAEELAWMTKRAQEKIRTSYKPKVVEPLETDEIDALNVASLFPDVAHTIDKINLHVVEKSKVKQVKKHINETLLQWWKGTILEVSPEEEVFSAILRDLNCVESIVVFEMKSVINLSQSKWDDFFEGRCFVYTIYSEHGKQSPVTRSKIELLPPDVLHQGDEEGIYNIYAELFPEE